jgi:hypothetical protein
MRMGEDFFKYDFNEVYIVIIILIHQFYQYQMV